MDVQYFGVEVSFDYQRIIVSNSMNVQELSLPMLQIVMNMKERFYQDY